jgi:single-stranded-DNA-specific exonuclease
VVGIVASRLKDRFHRPAVVFAPGEGDEIKGSGRSIGALHLRDCLDLVSKAHPALIRRFGGHAAAAGLSIARSDFDVFATAFEDAARTTLQPGDLNAELATDGPIESAYFNVQFVRALESEVWGQGFAGPVFADTFDVTSQRLVKDKHVKLALVKDGRKYDAIQFNATDPVPARAHIAFRLGVDEFNGTAKVGLYVEAWEPAQGRPL